MSDRVFARYTFKFVVLVEGEIPDDMSLGDIYRESVEGSYSGHWETDSLEYLTPAEMAEALIGQGSDPEFFRLNEKGDDLEDDDYDPHEEPYQGMQLDENGDSFWEGKL